MRPPAREVLDEALLVAGGRSAAVRLPASWPAPGPDIRTYRFEIGDRVRAGRLPGERFRIRCEACATAAEIRLDGDLIGTHAGDWVPFEAAIPEEVRGAGTLEIRVDSRPGHPTRGFLPTLGLVHAGLWQEVALLRTGPAVLRRDEISVRASGGVVRVHAPLDPPGPGRIHVAIRERSGPEGIGTGPVLAGADGTAPDLVLEDPGLRRWSPSSPWLYEARVSALLADGSVSDHAIVPFGLRSLAAEGDRLLLDGRPLLLRGLLHWGYYPEIGAPAPSRAALRREFSHLRLRGFNAVKCCLFVPARTFLDVADEMGILVWQEYPLWLKALAGRQLIDEYRAFFRHDRQHPSVVLRTLTCENDRLDRDTLDGLFEAARECLPPGELVLDNSAWLSLSARGDFHDEHPYLHDAQWDAYLDRTRAALERLPRKPLLLGETMACDALPSAADLAGPAPPLYAAALRRIYAEWSPDAVEPEGLRDRAARTASAVRRHQIERLRLKLPAAGYVLNSARDIPPCPCGFADSMGRPKTALEPCGGQADTMILADLPRRSYAAGETAHVPVLISHFGSGTLRVRDAQWWCGVNGGSLGTADVAPGTGAGLGEAFLESALSDLPEREDLVVDSGAGHEASWPLWFVPGHPVPEGIFVTRSLADALPVLDRGGAVVLLAAGPVAGGWRAPEFVHWSFIPHLPPHPLWSAPKARGPFTPDVRFEWSDLRRALRGETIALRLVEDLLPFDLLSGRVLAWERGAGTPVLEILDLHGKPGEARRLPVVLEARVGDGRLLVTALEHEDTPGGRWLLAEFARQLLRKEFDAAPLYRPGFVPTVMLDGPWTMERTRRVVRTGTPRRNGGANVFEGWETFTGEVSVPGAFAGGRVYLRAEAVGDAFEILVDGERLVFAGDEHGVLDGQRDVPRTFEVTGRVVPGRRHRVAFRIRDWRGGGGLVGPVYITTEDPEYRLWY